TRTTRPSTLSFRLTFSSDRHLRSHGGCLGTLLGVLVCIAGCTSSLPLAPRAARPPRKLVIFVADGLRHD
ncbi:MAG TPA: hypothetical protein VN750_05635, partial [Steroidobacteraceae bacterium]|nr:hypothetical protein [Steroidobacteraceae bacterium]